MINYLIKEIKKCLENEIYIVALTTALILPDICGKAEFPDEKPANRYKEWLKRNINFEKSIISSDEIYQLRCCLLHEGCPTFYKEKNRIGEFELLIQPFKSANKTMQSRNNIGSKSVRTINVEYLCEIIYIAAGEYFNKNKEKFNFFNYRIVNTDSRTASIFKISDDCVKFNL